jgi:hypothetical protein
MSASFWAAALMAFELLPRQADDAAGMSFNRQTSLKFQETLTNSEAPLWGSVGYVGAPTIRRYLDVVNL